MKIVVLCGGLSPERNVSLSSGTLICKALRARGHQAILVDMFFGVEESDKPLESLFEELPPLSEITVSAEAPDLDQVCASRAWKSPSKIGPGVLELCQCADVVFLGLHGACGEDGRIQATLDLMGIPYTGSGSLASALAMDKNLTKVLASSVGVRTPEWRVVSFEEKDIPEIAAGAKLPCVVKPIDSGSSIGVSIVNTPQEMEAALRVNLKLGRVLLEQRIKGREIDIAVLEDRTLPPIEIIPREGFYDYKNKYQAGATLEICPADLSDDMNRQLSEATLKVHRRLGLKDYSRADFMISEEGVLYFLEINTLPGMTPTSLMPQEAAVVGIDYETLCQRLVDLALEGRQ